MATKTGARWFMAVAVVALALGSITGALVAADKEGPPDLSRALGKAKIFAGLSEGERDTLKSAATLRRCKAGERIIEQGKPLGSMFIVLEGQAEVRVNGKVVATLPEQSLVGEVEFLDMLPSSAEVVILKEGRLIELNSDGLRDLMKKNPRLGYVLMSEIARVEGQRLRAMDQAQP